MKKNTIKNNIKAWFLLNDFRIKGINLVIIFIFANVDTQIQAIVKNYH